MSGRARERLDWQLGALALGFVALLAVPMVFSSFWISLLSSILILVVFALSFNLLFGYTGLLSFGQAAFYGIGAYTVTLSLTGGVWFVPAFVAATLLAAVIGAISVQRGQLSFAMLTLGLSMLVYNLLFEFDDITGGANGLIVPNAEVNLFVVSFPIRTTVPFYYLALGTFVVVALVLYRIVNSPYGEILQAIRENPERAEFNGIPVTYYQWTVFVISGAVAGLAGGLIAPHIFIVSPNLTHWSMSAQPLLVTILGGPSYFLGPVVGALGFTAIEEWATSITNYWQIVLGLVLIPIVLYFPNGLVGLLASAKERLENLTGPTTQSGSDESVEQED